MGESAARLKGFRMLREAVASIATFRASFTKRRKRQKTCMIGQNLAHEIGIFLEFRLGRYSFRLVCARERGRRGIGGRSRMTLGGGELLDFGCCSF